MVTATIINVIDLSKSFHAKVGSDYRVYIPKEIRKGVERIRPNDVVWLIIGTVYPNPDEKRLILP